MREIFGWRGAKQTASSLAVASSAAGRWALLATTVCSTLLISRCLADEPPKTDPPKPGQQTQTVESAAPTTLTATADKEIKSDSAKSQDSSAGNSSAGNSSAGNSSAGNSSKDDSSDSSGQSKHPRASARELSRAFRDAAAVALPSVVTIKVRTKAVEDGGVIDIIGGDDASFDGFGSGVIIEQDGLILTNHHVVKDYKHIEVMLLDGRQLVARDVKSDPPSDLAILRIEANEKLPIAEIGDARELDVGDWVLAIGSPFKLHSSVSAGIISGKNRPLGDLVPGRFLQTDAAVNPGNSGGPLIDLDGKVIGINTAISSNSGTFQGVGFAIPINRALWVKKELEEHGRVRRARMGAQLGAIPTEVAKQLEMTAGGAYVVSVAPGRPAATAGIMSGDIVISFDHQRVSDKEELREMITVSPIDQPIEMVIVRSGEKKTLTIKLEPIDQ